MRAVIIMMLFLTPITTLKNAALQYAELYSPLRNTELSSYVKPYIYMRKDAEAMWKLTGDARRCISKIEYRVDWKGIKKWNKKRQPCTNASIAKCAEGWYIQPAVRGDRLKLPQLRKALEQGKKPLTLQHYIKEPSVEAPMLVSQVAFLNSRANWYVKYKNKKELRLDPSYFDEQGNLDTERFRSALDDVLLSYYTIGKGAMFKPTGAKKPRFVKGGTWGCDVNNDAEYEYLLDKVLKGEPQVKRLPIFTQEQLEIGKTYIEVSLQKQHMWYYIKGKLKLEADVVTGLPTPERQTPTGVYYLLECKDGKWLTGDDYRTWVDYWMRVTWSGVGFHDAPWQYAFGGERYKTYGSHGCINLAPNVAKLLYSMCDEFTPVIIY